MSTSENRLSPVSAEEERLARAIRKARDFDPDTLYQHLGDDYPIDSTDSEGRTFYKSWRKELPSVRAVLAEQRAAAQAARCPKCDGEGFINRHANLPDEPCPECSGKPADPIADQIIGQIEERFSNWRSYRDLIDCIDCTLHQLRAQPQGAHSEARANRLTLAIQRIVEANADFRKSMPGDWEGDPLQDKITAAAAMIAAEKKPWREGEPSECDSSAWDRLPPEVRACRLLDRAKHCIEELAADLRLAI